MNSTDKYWLTILFVTVLFVCSWVTMEIWHSFHQAPLTPQQEFAQACERNTISINGNINPGIPNTQTQPWTCTFTKQPVMSVPEGEGEK